MISELERKLLGIMMIVIMFGMGSGLVWKDFFRALKKPQGLFIGAISQFGLMPLIAYTLGIALNLSPEASIGLLIMGCVPGGTTSNIFTYFSKGDLALSIMMTVFSTLLAVVLTPILIFTYGAKILQDSQLDVPFGDVSMTLFVLLVPVAIGMFVRKMNANVGAVSEFIGGLLGIFVILFLIVTWIPRNAGLLATTPLNIYLASLGLGLCGFALGYLFARLARQNEKRAMTICLETGIQNGPLGIAIVLFSFPEEVRQGILLIPVLYSLFIVLSSAAATVFFRKWMTRLEQQKLKTELL
ncbi:MAG: bile acid:sodium symporter [Pseudobdellovibrionaceae bacterium]